MTEKEKQKKTVKKAAPQKKSAAKADAPKKAPQAKPKEDAPKKEKAAKPAKPVKTVSLKARGVRRERQGVVVSDKMQKTIVVEVTRLVSHPEYGRVIKKKSKAVAHDEKEVAKTGDKVRIIEVKPISKTKRWRLVEVLKQ
jgi:small subunit ribosomal protein S17